MVLFLLGVVQANPTVDVGMGARDAFREEGLFDGLRGVVHVGLGFDGLGIEVSGFVDRPAVADDLSIVLLNVANAGPNGSELVVDRSLERYGAGVWLDWGFGERATGRRLSGGPKLLAGLQVVSVDRVALSYDDAAPATPSVVEKGSRVIIPLLMGFSSDLWFYDRVGLRLALFERLAVHALDDFFAGDRQLGGFTGALDVMVRL